jgi:hypothetical protein
MRAVSVAALAALCVATAHGEEPGVLRSSDVFSLEMVGETWTLRNALGDVTTIDVQPSPYPECAVLFFAKSTARAYWSPGAADAKIQFEICRDSDGGWYSSRSIMSGSTDAGGNAYPWKVTSNVGIVPSMPRAYQIIPPMVSEGEPSALVSEFRNYNLAERLTSTTLPATRARRSPTSLGRRTARSSKGACRSAAIAEASWS